MIVTRSGNSAAMFDQIIIADHSHLNDINQLVNMAYRPDSSKQTWTNETGIIHGPRIKPQQLAELIGKAKSFILLGFIKQQMVACAHIQQQDDTAYIGMLTVDTQRQNAGLGKQILDKAEQFASQQLGCTTFQLSVISVRESLIQFYLRRGYQRTGELQPYPLQANAGTPIVDNLHIESLIKVVD